MGASERDFSVETACKLPPGHFADATTNDGHVISFWERPNGRVPFGWDGRAEHPTFDGIEQMRDKSPAIFCSGDGAHIAYVGMRGDRFFVGGMAPKIRRSRRSAGRSPQLFDDRITLVMDGEPGPAWKAKDAGGRHSARTVGTSR